MFEHPSIIIASWDSLQIPSLHIWTVRAIILTIPQLSVTQPNFNSDLHIYAVLTRHREVMRSTNHLNCSSIQCRLLCLCVKPQAGLFKGKKCKWKNTFFKRCSMHWQTGAQGPWIPICPSKALRLLCVFMKHFNDDNQLDLKHQQNIPKSSREMLQAWIMSTTHGKRSHSQKILC